MTPESFNTALAQRKLEAADILLHQAKRGSDADRIRAASAILRIAFIPSPSLREGTGGRVRSATDIPATPDRPTPAAHPAPASPPLPLPAGEGRGEGVTTTTLQSTDLSRHTPVPPPTSPFHRGGLAGSPSHPHALT